MLPEKKKKALAALKRLDGLSSKLEGMIDDDVYCGDILTMLLAMQGHLKHMQGVVLESHLQTCAPKQLTAKGKKQSDFIAELMNVIGLSSRS